MGALICVYACNHEAASWPERVYGLASLAVDLELLDKFLLDKALLSAKNAEKDKETTNKGAKNKAIDLKAQAKHPVWHAWKMYSDLENLQREWVIFDTTKHLQTWFQRQCADLKGVQSSYEWLEMQCMGGYWDHIRETLNLLDTNARFSKWGVEIDHPADVLSDEGIAAHVAQQDEFSGYAGDMILGIAKSRMKWGMDFLAGFPRRLVLLATAVWRPAAVAELKGWYELLEKMEAAPSPTLKARGERSHLHHVAVKQFAFVLKRKDWVVDDTVIRMTLDRFRRVEGTRMIEEAHRVQNNFVHKNPVHRVSHNAAYYGLNRSDLIRRYGFSSAPDALAEDKVDLVMDDSYFETKDSLGWPPLRELPGFSRTSKWYSPAADDVHDSIFDLLCCKQMGNDLEGFDDVLLWSMLLCGDRTILQHKESSAWYVVLGVAAGCCTLAIPVVRHTVGFAHNYFTLSPPESFQEWCPLVIRSPDHWAAASFVWASPLHQLQTDPTKELLAHTKKRIVIMIDGAVSDLVKHAAQCAFYSIGKAAMLKMASKLDIEVDASLPLFEFLCVLVAKVTGADEEGVLEIMRLRTMKDKKADHSSKALKHFAELQDVMTLDERKIFKEVEKNADVGEPLAKTMKAAWRAKKGDLRKKRAEAATAAAKAGPAKKKRRRCRARSLLWWSHRRMTLIWCELGQGWRFRWTQWSSQSLRHCCLRSVRSGTTGEVWLGPCISQDTSEIQNLGWSWAAMARHGL